MSTAARRTTDGPATDAGLAGMRSTRQRQAILGAVERLGVFASARTIHDALEAAGEHVGLSTVYRTLPRLVERRTLDAVRAQDGEMLYRRCQGSPHEHLVCRRCGVAVEVPDTEMTSLVQTWARQAGFEDVEHIVEIFGTCRQCRDAASLESRGPGQTAS